MTRLSQHAIERGRERLKLKAKSLTRLSQHAFDRGLAPSAFRGSFRRFLDGCAMRARCTVRVHGEHVYIFSVEHEPKLITVMPVPPRHRRLIRRLSQLRKQEAAMEDGQGHEGAVEEHTAAKTDAAHTDSPDPAAADGAHSDKAPIDQADGAGDAAAGTDGEQGKAE